MSSHVARSDCFSGSSHLRPLIHKSCKKILNGMRTGANLTGFDVSESTWRFETIGVVSF